MKATVIFLLAIVAIATATGTGSGSSSGSGSVGPQTPVVKTSLSLSRQALLSQSEINQLSTLFKNNMADLKDFLVARQSLVDVGSIASLLDLPFQDVTASTALTVELYLYPKNTAAALLTQYNAARTDSAFTNGARDILGVDVDFGSGSIDTAGEDCSTKCVVQDASCGQCQPGSDCAQDSDCLSGVCEPNSHKCTSLPSSASSVAASLVTVGALAVTATVARYL